MVSFPQVFWLTHLISIWYLILLQPPSHRLYLMGCYAVVAHLRQQGNNSKFMIFQERLLKVLKCYNFLWVQRRHNCSPAASFANCVMTLYLLKVHMQTFLSISITQKYRILSCDTLVANERYCRAEIYKHFGRAGVWDPLFSIHFSTLKMQELPATNGQAYLYQTTRRHIPEKSTLHFFVQNISLCYRIEKQ